MYTFCSKRFSCASFPLMFSGRRFLRQWTEELDNPGQQFSPQARQRAALTIERIGQLG
jgi:hypothetical protein